jgi:flagellar motor switch/type III secretory pathway protein FliN
MPAPVGANAGAPSRPGAKSGTGELVPVAPALVTTPAQSTGTAFSPLVLRLPVELDVAVPVREFRVRNLLALAPGELIESQWGNGIDLPLAAGDVQLAWTEFEVVETKLAVRITRVV